MKTNLLLALSAGLLVSSLGMSYTPRPGGIIPGPTGPGGIGPSLPFPGTIPLPGGLPFPGSRPTPGGLPIPGGGVTDPYSIKINVPIPAKICTTTTKTVCTGTGNKRVCKSETIEKCIEVRFRPNEEYRIPYDVTQVKIYDGNQWQIYNQRGQLQRSVTGSKYLYNSSN